MSRNRVGSGSQPTRAWPKQWPVQYADENGVHPPAKQLYPRTSADLAVLRHRVHHDAMELTMEEDGLRRVCGQIHRGEQ